MGRSPVGVSALILVVIVGGIAIAGPLIWGGQASTIDPSAILEGPSPKYLLGSDGLGRDILYRLLVATRLSVELALLSTAVSVAIGLALGTSPTVLPRSAARLITGLVGILVAFPSLLLILFFSVIFGVGENGAILALAAANAPFYARMTQTLARSVEGRDFIAAARIAGVSRIGVLGRHILPNIQEQIVISAAFGAGGTLVAFSALSFLGIGIQPPQYDWGRMLNEGLNGIYANPLGALAPAAAIMLAGLAFSLLGEAIAQATQAPQEARWGGRRPTPAINRVEANDDEGANPVLLVRDLSVQFPAKSHWSAPVRGVSFQVNPREAVGIVGESGSGKSLTALAISQLIESPGRVRARQLEFMGKNLLSSHTRSLRQQLGMQLANVFQDPLASFNPARRIGSQLAEVPRIHQGLPRGLALARAIDRLRRVRIAAPEKRVRQFPHEFSGGMRQRAMIAMGLMASPQLIIADEPTSALDATVQQQVMRVLAEMRASVACALLLISHDIMLVGQMCDRILVMYAGRIVEDLPAADLFSGSRHPYTRLLVSAVPDMDADLDRPLTVIPGRPPDPAAVPSGCAFAPRCPNADAKCRQEDPVLVKLEARHRVACWHPNTSIRQRSEPGMSQHSDVVTPQQSPA